VVQKHLEHPFRKPLSEHTQTAFDEIKPLVETHLAKNQPLIFDSCCGTAMSTRIIAEDNPEALVIGIDRSKVRLGKEYNADFPENAITVQAECGDFWILAQAQGWKLTKHSIFYPNPYPKSKHLKRRWHGHPAFPALLALGGELELRTNWKVYVDEFSLAVGFAIDKVGLYEYIEAFQSNIPMTLFEKKYQESQQELYRFRYGL
jgi:tRNA G46 methylase TrmB